MSCRPVWLLSLVLSALAVPAAAHPGHGAAGNAASPSHYLTEPVHALVLVAGILVATVAGSWIARKTLSHRRV